MNNTTRYLFAGVLIFLIILLQPTYLKWLGYNIDSNFVDSDVSGQTLTETGVIGGEGGVVAPRDEDVSVVNAPEEEFFITISTPLYTATLTNKSGGSFVNYTLIGENSGKLKLNTVVLMSSGCVNVAEKLNK